MGEVNGLVAIKASTKGGARKNANVYRGFTNFFRALVEAELDLIGPFNNMSLDVRAFYNQR